MTAEWWAARLWETVASVKVTVPMYQTITYHPIGIIHTPFDRAAGMPIQPAGARGVRGRIELLPELAPGLKDLDGFSHIILLYHFDRVCGCSALTARPFLDKEEHGIFAIRAPRRPNPIGLSVVRLLSIENNILHVEDVDVLDGTPLLDIKPFVPEFDAPEVDRLGWLEGRASRAEETRADQRFE